MRTAATRPGSSSSRCTTCGPTLITLTRGAASGVASGVEQAVMAKARAAINATGVLKVLIAVHNAAQAADRF